MEDNCEFCKVNVGETEHHLIPCEYHDRNWFKRRYTKEELNKTVTACVDCHKTIHAFFTNRDLAYDLNTVEKLLSNEYLSRYVKWAVKRTGKKSKTARRNKR